MKHKKMKEFMLVILIIFIAGILVNPAGHAIKIKNDTLKKEKITQTSNTPDLIISKVKIKTLYRERETKNINYKPYDLQVIVTVKNIGDGYIFRPEISKIYVSIKVDGKDKGYISFDDKSYFWNPGCEVTKKKVFDNLIKDGNAHEFSYMVDCFNEVKEENEDNNILFDEYKIPNKAPYKPSIGYDKDRKAYWASTGDHENDEIRYGWDLDNDNIVDKWSNYTESAKSIYFFSERYKKVKVLAEDVYGAKSEWSDICKKSKQKITITSILIKYFYNILGNIYIVK